MDSASTQTFWKIKRTRKFLKRKRFLNRLQFCSIITWKFEFLFEWPQLIPTHGSKISMMTISISKKYPVIKIKKKYFWVRFIFNLGSITFKEVNGQMLSQTPKNVSFESILDGIEQEKIVRIKVAKKIGKNCFLISFWAFWTLLVNEKSLKLIRNN